AAPLSRYGGQAGVCFPALLLPSGGTRLGLSPAGMAERQDATSSPHAWVALPVWADASYQRSTRSALKVFHRLGVPSGSSNRKWTAPGWVFSSSQRPSGRRLARTPSIASASRGSGVPPRRAKYSVALSRS